MKFDSKLLAGLVLCSSAGFSLSALAVPVVVTGYDATANKVVVPGNAPAVARANFEATLSGIGAPLLREDMEGMTVPGALANQSPIAFSFGSITGTAITPSNEALSLPLTGVFNTTAGGSKFIDALGSVTITFAQALSGFGLYFTDLGDFNDSLITATLALAGGGTAQVNVQRGGDNASLLFFGVVESDPNVHYASITFNTNGGDGTDVFGMDDFVGVVGETDERIPVPATITLLAAGLLGIGAIRRRKN